MKSNYVKHKKWCLIKTNDICLNPFCKTWFYDIDFNLLLIMLG